MANDKIPIFALVGGFLGSGKTTLILRAAALLREQGLRVAVITNDQDSGLVDTKLSEAQELRTGEVAGGCFCCRFSELLDAAEQLTAFRPDVIFAEPVGSCVDISATIMQPLKAYHRDEYRLAPFSVLVDPDLAKLVFEGRADPDVGFLFKKQVAEADILCGAKLDRYAAMPELPVPVDFWLSAVTGQGVREWVDEVLSFRRTAGSRVLDVDYTRYAEAEAALGWLNLHATAELSTPSSPAAVVGPLLDEIDSCLTQAGITIAHLKIFDQAGPSYVKAGVCRNGDEPVPDGDMTASPEGCHELVINLRAIGDPNELRAVVRGALASIGGSITIRHEGAFRPAPPKPQHRFSNAT